MLRDKVLVLRRFEKPCSWTDVSCWFTWLSVEFVVEAGISKVSKLTRYSWWTKFTLLYSCVKLLKWANRIIELFVWMWLNVTKCCGWIDWFSMSEPHRILKINCGSNIVFLGIVWFSVINFTIFDRWNVFTIIWKYSYYCYDWFWWRFILYDFQSHSSVNLHGMGRVNSVCSCWIFLLYDFQVILVWIYRVWDV